VPHALYFSHPACLGHDTGDHPERAERITALEASLRQRDWLGYERRQAAPATREALVAVHAGEYVDTVRSMTERGGAVAGAARGDRG
jgi:acetoin utilization deacetylase AcuC-like enzyme